MKTTKIALGLVLALSVVIYYVGCRSTAFTSAKVYIQQDNWDKAIEQLEIEVAQNPRNAEAHYLLGRGYGTKGLFEKMNKEFDASLALSKKWEKDINMVRRKYWADHFNAGVKAVKQQNFELALANFKTATVIDPKAPDSYKNLGFVYSRLDSLDKAAEAYKKALELDPKDVKSMLSLGSVYYNQKKYQEAADVLEQALSLEPTNAEAISLIALCYDLLGQSEKALEAYNRAIAANPTDKDMYFNLGRLFFVRKDYDRAIENFKKVLEFDPNDFEAVFNIGNAYLNKADSLFKQRQEIIGDRTEIPKADYEKLEKIYEVEKGYYEKALEFLEKASELQPDNASVWNNLGIIYVRIGEKEKGKEAFDKADQLMKAKK